MVVAVVEGIACTSGYYQLRLVRMLMLARYIAYRLLHSTLHYCLQI